jgi:hypothetical protein
MEMDAIIGTVIVAAAMILLIVMVWWSYRTIDRIARMSPRSAREIRKDLRRVRR